MNIRERFKGRGTRLICGWCRKEFYADTKKDKTTKAFPVITHCGRILPASKKELTGNLVGRKRWKIEYKDGDVAG